jgi:phosphoribosylformylglycinamidine synthase
LAQVLVESCRRGGRGASITLPGDPFVALFSESAARAVIAVPATHLTAVRSLAVAYGVEVTELGLTGGAVLTFTGLFEVPLAELDAAATGTFPALFG